MAVLRLSSPIILALALLSPLVLAAPAPRAIKVRDYVTEVVTETVWTTVNVTTTVYVDELPSTSVPAKTTAESSPTAVVEPEFVTTSTPVPEAAAPEPASSESTSSQAAPATPSPDAGELVESSAPPTPEYTPPVTPSPPKVPDHAPPAPAPEAYPPAPEAASSPTTPVIDAVKSSGGSETADCQGGSSSCKGDVTHWEGGLGACGTVVDTDGENAIALPHEFMGPLSNSNPYCGKSITVKNPVSGTTVQGTVKDKCMGCVGRSIDLTSKMFKAVTDGTGDGREYNFEWWFS